MDLQIEANRNSALFNTFQQVLDVYNPLLHKARPTVVNQAKHRIRVQPTRWGNTLSAWNGTQTVRFDLPRIGSLADFTLKCAFDIPGLPPTDAQRMKYGTRGYAKAGLTTGGLDNSRSYLTDTAGGRLDRIYADRLFGFNMIKEYVVSSKSRVIFRAPGEYLLTRFSQMDNDTKEAVLRATTPVDLFSGDADDAFYAPATMYQLQIPLFAFFNEHITMALDVNFSEEVHIDVTLRAPSELFYYGNLGNMRYTVNGTDDATAGVNEAETFGTGFMTRLSASNTAIAPRDNVNNDHGDQDGNHNKFPVTWDQSYKFRYTPTDLGLAPPLGDISHADPVGVKSQPTNWISFNQAFYLAETSFEFTPLSDSEYTTMIDFAINHIRGYSRPFNTIVGATSADVDATYGDAIAGCKSGTTFAFPNVDNLNESCRIQFEGSADYIIQDTDAYRALRAQMFPEGTGLTQIAYNVAHETWNALFDDINPDKNLLSQASNGTFVDPDQSKSGINIGDTTRYSDLQIRVNNLCSSTHFMVRKVSDMGGNGFQTAASGDTLNYGQFADATNNIGAHRLYTRCIPIHYFQVLAAGRVIYESDGDTQLDLTQSTMYQGTGQSFGIAGSNATNTGTGVPSSGSPFNVYSINWGLTVSRLENTGCVSWQNLNNPILRIYYKPDDWAEHDNTQNSNDGHSNADLAASQGVRVDILHEFFNVITINSGNGEITSGLNQ